jgi:hypothetical protein
MKELLDFVHNSVKTNFEKGYASRSAVIFSSLARYKFNRAKLESFFFELASPKSDFAIFIPAFTYSSRRNRRYSNTITPDPLNGALSKVAFQNGNLPYRRTLDVDYSYLLFNEKSLRDPHLEGLFKHREASFGIGSHHADLFGLNPTLIALGEGYRDGFTPAMHIEALSAVPYREFIDTSCVVDGEQVFKRQYFARKEIGEFANLEANRRVMSNLFECGDSYMEKKFQFGGEACAISSSEFSSILLHKLKERPNFFVE